MILKIIETNTTPKMGDLVKLKSGKLVLAQTSNDGFIGWYIYLGVKGGILHVHFKEDDKVVLPYGISYEERPFKGDVIWDVDTNIISVCTYLQQSVSSKGNIDLNWYKKVVILPEQFNYQEIVDLGLKDGSNFDYINYDTINPFDIKISIINSAKSPPVTYTEEEVFALIKLLGEDFSIEDYVGELEEWFNINKKKI
jgi:hypothetical protein